MILPWLYLRLWFFPVHVIWRVVEECSTWPEKTFNWHFITFQQGFLIVLACMHIFWLYIMIKGFIRRFGNGDWKERVILKN